MAHKWIPDKNKNCREVYSKTMHTQMGDLIFYLTLIEDNKWEYQAILHDHSIDQATRLIFGYKRTKDKAQKAVLEETAEYFAKITNKYTNLVSQLDSYIEGL